MAHATFENEPLQSTPHDSQSAAGGTPAAENRSGAEDTARSFRDALLSRLERRLLDRMLESLGHPAVTVVLWNGETIDPESGSRETRVRIHSRQVLWKLLADPLFEFGEAYSSGEIEVDGNLIGFLAAIQRSTQTSQRKPFGLRLWQRFRNRPHLSTLSAARENIHRHYDLGNDFYRIWLNEDMVYTCAYYERPEMTLDQAQVAKMDHVCRKVWLQPGETVVEAGCGWGSLSLHMAREYGVQVRAFNISHEQIQFARRRVREAGLEDRVEFVEDDWRNITGQYDAFVSVGMLEHVGRSNYSELGEIIHRSLKPHGRGLIHSIGRNRPRPFDRWTEQRVFPGAYAPALREMLAVFEKRDFAVLDVENLRLHYAKTLRHWLDRFEASAGTVQDMFDERFVRMWRLYLASSMTAFQTGGLQLFQIAFARGSLNEIPWTRAYLYDDKKPPHFTIRQSGGNGCSGAKC